MKALLALVMVFSVSCEAAAGKKQDQAVFKAWEEMFYHRAVVAGIKEHCPHLSEVGLITTHTPTPSDWSENDNRYDVMDRYESRGTERGEKVVKSFVKERGAADYCSMLLRDYGPTGKVYAEVVVVLPKLTAEEMHVTLGEFSTRMTMTEAEAAFGSPASCIKRDNRYLEYCVFSKGESNFRGRQSGELVRMRFSRDGRVFELERVIDLPAEMREGDAMAQVREKFASFGEPYVHESGANVWRIREELDVVATVNDRRLSIRWEDETLKEANLDAVLDEKRRYEGKIKDEAAKEKLKL